MLPPPPHILIMFELDFDVKFPLLHLLLFISDLKSTIFSWIKEMFPYYQSGDQSWQVNIYFQIRFGVVYLIDISG